MPAADKRERVTHIYKASADVRVGISLQKDSAPIFIGEGTEAHRNGLLPPVVRGVNPGGLAAQAGLQVGDMIVQINREKAISNLSAAAMLREAEGDIEVRFLPRLYVLGPEMDAARTAPVAPLDLSGVHNDARPGEAGGGDYTSRFFAEANRLFEETSRQISLSLGHAPKPGAPKQPQPATPRNGGGGLSEMISSLFGKDRAKSATRLQTAFRAHRARRLLATHRWAATTLQAAARGKAVRRQADEQRLDRAEQRAATRIQAASRARAARKSATKLRAERHGRHRRTLSFQRRKHDAAPDGHKPYKPSAPPPDDGGGRGGGGGLLRRLSFSKRKGHHETSYGEASMHAAPYNHAYPQAAPARPAPLALPPSTQDQGKRGGGGVTGTLRRTLSFGKK